MLSYYNYDRLPTLQDDYEPSRINEYFTFILSYNLFPIHLWSLQSQHNTIQATFAVYHFWILFDTRSHEYTEGAVLQVFDLKLHRNSTCMPWLPLWFI